MAFFWHGNSASVRLQNPPKASKTPKKPSKHLERDPTPDVTLVCDSHDDRFLQTAQISLKRCRFPYISLKRLKTPWHFQVTEHPCSMVCNPKNSLKTLKFAQTVPYSGRDARVLAGILKSFSGYQVCNPKN